MIYCVLGSSGLVGSAVVRKLKEIGDEASILAPSRKEVDLCDYSQTLDFLKSSKPDIVFLCAAKAGGIKSNNEFKADYITINLKIQTNVIESCHLAGIDNLIFLGSSCIYPKHSQIPIKEEYLLSGYLEPTNDAYAIAKIAGIKMCQSYNDQHGRNYISVMPCNLYGPGDNFDLNSSHVLPALIRKFHEAKLAKSPTVEVWGTGKPKREFLYVEDLAEALILLAQHYKGSEIINVGSGEDHSILELVDIVKSVVGYEGEIVFNTSYPDGTLRKMMDVTRIREFGWKPKTSLEEGIKETYKFFCESNSLKLFSV